MRTQALFLSASMLAVACCGVANAQTNSSSSSNRESSGPIETVVVTAERRAENLQTTAISATVLTATDLLNKDVVKIDDLQFVSPSVTVNNFGQGIDFDIRGIGKGEHNTQTLTGVITYRDDAATFQGYMQGEPYYDIASVQVLRGPQGTFVGQNAIGGAVYVTTQSPTLDGDWGGYVQASYGNYNEGRLEGAVNIPITDTLAVRLAAYGDARGSFFSIMDRDPVDACPGNKYSGCQPGYNPGDLRMAAGRLSVLWKPVDRLTVLFKYDADYMDFGAYPGNGYWQRFKTIPAGPGAAFLGAAGNPNPTYSDLFKIHYNFPQLALDRFTRAILKVDYEFPNGIVLRSVSQFANGNTNWMTDLDLSDTGSPYYGGAKNYGFYDIAEETLYTQEINLISPSTWRFNWVFGLMGQSDLYDFPQNPAYWVSVPDNSHKIFQNVYQNSDLWGKNATAAYAVFGQVGYKITDDFQVKLGGRYSISTTANNVWWDQYGALYHMTPHTLSPSGKYAGWAKFYSLDYKASVDWKVNDNNFLYAFIATGFKPGGLNPPLAYQAAQTNPEPFGEEHVTSYEAGWKATLLDGHLRSQLSAYYNDYKGFIVVVGYPPATGGFGATTELNDPKSTTAYGVELEADAVYGDFTFGSGLGLMHDSLGAFWAMDGRARVAGVCNPESGPPAGTSPTSPLGLACVNLKDHPMTYAPDVTYNISAEYRFHLENGDTLTPRVNFGHQNPQWATLFDNVSFGDKLSARDLLGGQLEWKHDTYVVTLFGTNLLDQHYVGALISGIDMPGPPRQFGIRLLKVW